MSYLLLFGLPCMIHAIPWPSPSPTTAVEYIEYAVTNLPTSAPEFNLELLRRATSTKTTTSWSGWGLEVCGWEDGDYSSVFSCSQTTDTCLWNSRNSVVGCGNTAVIPHFTACADFNSTSCDSACSANANILKCGILNEHCYTIKFPNSYTMPTCGFSANMSMAVDTTYGGLPTPIFLPRYLGPDNILTVETQIPDGRNPGPTSGTIGKPLQTGSPYPTIEATKKRTAPVGPIVGGVLGGLVLVAAIGVGIWLLFRRRRRQKTATEERKAGKTQDVNSVHVSPPYELGGKPKTAHEIG